uniref:WW domain-containing protein n=1 Tax=Aplanochytrium stocchinoi TaxID=215587 RepID=A0A7S3PGE6_9STRA|mmetsp:Transcript_4586/g.5796  ORF Transcript_4586/g.5796 Transcript_4586/m.5796 type:complete len:347 (+) Transcript_4586:183-1223(+)|eukprot:CAMPEP_0204862314 /NCGR_PEP_ID=MMETSP1348-20121228/2382_1 /ASSEMBLY_ACC=CAM_ASM_000700 /TAXON_ID=215587 /ORGANISM="Aplanochytrium stocchinoi, Strain GSBS06" /LENGTH=346 /DNA_ID=CAMNT_0052012165 /DNA_START=212 /DNA_END=1252 /DNA_ORIENTATION=+
MSTKNSKSSESKKGHDSEQADLTTVKTNSKGAVITGIPYWTEYIDEKTGRAFFLHKLTKKRSWGLPLKDVLKDPRMKGPSGDDDWECHIDPKTFKRFYRSKMYKKLQWKMPHIYGTTVGRLPYFSDEYVKERLAARNNKIVEKNDGITAQAVMKKVSLLDAIENNVVCAAFHRFLVATYAEENLLFYGAVEVFDKGEWKGMKTLGVEMKNAMSNNLDEGSDMLQQQLKASRASMRMGMMEKPKTMKAEAGVIYDKFLQSDSELWVCVSEGSKQEIIKQITEATDTTDLRGIFDSAQEQVYESMIEALYPRFITIEMKEDSCKGFEADEVVRATLLQLGGFTNEFLS